MAKISETSNNDVMIQGSEATQTAVPTLSKSTRRTRGTQRTVTTKSLSRTTGRKKLNATKKRKNQAAVLTKNSQPKSRLTKKEKDAERRSILDTHANTGAQNDSMKVYMQNIGQISLVSKAEEITLAADIHGQDIDKHDIARDVLIKANLRLVVKIAHDFKARGQCRTNTNGRTFHFFQHTIDAASYTQDFLKWLHMNITGPLFKSIRKQVIHRCLDMLIR